jgi:hypothetical protein
LNAGFGFSECFGRFVGWNGFVSLSGFVGLNGFVPGFDGIVVFEDFGDSVSYFPE